MECKWQYIWSMLKSPIIGYLRYSLCVGTINTSCSYSSSIDNGCQLLPSIRDDHTCITCDITCHWHLISPVCGMPLIFDITCMWHATDIWYHLLCDMSLISDIIWHVTNIRHSLICGITPISDITCYATCHWHLISPDMWHVTDIWYYSLWYEIVDHSPGDTDSCHLTTWCSGFRCIYYSIKQLYGWCLVTYYIIITACSTLFTRSLFSIWFTFYIPLTFLFSLLW